MKKHRKLLTLGVVICLVAGLVAGIVYYKQAEEERKLSLIYIPKVVDGTNDFWTSLIQGAEMAAKEYNADIRVWAPEEENDVDGQNKLIERATEEKPDAILISPSSFTESDQLLKKAKEQGIHIAFIDSYTQEEVQDLTVATDNLEAGQILGRFAKELVGTDDQIAIVSHVKGVSTAVEREKGFRTGLGSLKDNIVDVVYCDSQYDKSYELTKELMKKYPDLKMIAGMNEYSSVGAARAVKAAKAENRIRVVGVDSSQEAVQLMEHGIFQGIVVQKAFKMGYVGVRETVKMLRGEDYYLWSSRWNRRYLLCICIYNSTAWLWRSVQQRSNRRMCNGWYIHGRWTCIHQRYNHWCIYHRSSSGRNSGSWLYKRLSAYHYRCYCYRRSIQ